MLAVRSLLLALVLGILSLTATPRSARAQCSVDPPAGGIAAPALPEIQAPLRDWWEFTFTDFTNRFERALTGSTRVAPAARRSTTNAPVAEPVPARRRWW